MFKCKSRLYCVCVLHVSVHFLHPFCFLLLRLDHFNCPLFRLAASFLCLFQSALEPLCWLLLFWARQQSCPLIGLLAVPLASSWAMFFWVPLLGTVTFPGLLCLPLPLLPLNITGCHLVPPLLCQKLPSSWYRHLRLPSWMVFHGEVGKETKLPSIIFVRRGSKLCIS